MQHGPLAPGLFILTIQVSQSISWYCFLLIPRDFHYVSRIFSLVRMLHVALHHAPTVVLSSTPLRGTTGYKVQHDPSVVSAFPPIFLSEIALSLESSPGVVFERNLSVFTAFRILISLSFFFRPRRLPACHSLCTFSIRRIPLRYQHHVPKNVECGM